METPLSQTSVPGAFLNALPIQPIQTIGRALVGVLFLVSGALKIGKFAGVAAGLAGKGLPLPEVMTALVIALEVAGGLALVFGWRVRDAALALALFCIPATLMFHAFWSVDAAAFGNQLNHFLKNVAIFGALLVIASSANRPRDAAPFTPQ
jgi:putative oxidoreductase